MLKLDICGSGWCDSPGHCAKYETYTVMDENTNKVLDFKVIQVTEVSSSNAMEAEGCNEVLKNMKKKGVKGRCLTMMLKYCRKQQHFGNQGMIAHTQLAAVDRHGSSQGSL